MRTTKMFVAVAVLPLLLMSGDATSRPQQVEPRSNCRLLFTYVTATSAFNTGIVVANTTGDVSGISRQRGKVTFYFYDRAAGLVGQTTTTADIEAGRSFVDLASAILPTGVTSFSGYVLAKAEFQSCHGYAFFADSAFAAMRHGYIAVALPDPATKENGLNH